MGQVYSTNLGTGEVPVEGVLLLGPAPDGYRWILRDFELSANLLAPFPVALSTGPVVGWFNPEGEGEIVPWWFRGAGVVPSGTSIEWHGRQVCPDGWQIYVGGNMAGWYYSFSGYQLALP